MVTTLPSYVPTTLKSSTQPVRFDDELIPNFLYKHTDTEIDDKTSALIHSQALVSRDAELLRLNQAKQQGKINETMYTICWYLYNNVAFQHADTSLANNGYFLDMHAMTDFVLNASRASAEQVVYRYMFLSDLLVLDVYARHNPTQTYTKSKIAKDIATVLEQPHYVDFKIPQIKSTPIEWSIGLATHNLPSTNGNKYAINNRLHYFGLKMQEMGSQGKMRQDDMILQEFLDKYEFNIREDIKEASMYTAVSR